MALIKLASIPGPKKLTEVLDKLKELEAKLGEMPRDAKTPPTPRSVPASFSQEETPKASKKTEEDESAQTDKKDEQAPKKTSEGKEADSADISAINDIWHDALKELRQKKMSIASFLLEARPVKFSGGVLHIGFPKQFVLHKEAVEETNNKKMIEEAFSSIIGRKVKIDFVFNHDDKGQLPKTENGNNSADDEEESGGENENLLNTEPIVQTAINIFQGRVLKKKKR
jgi:hypothetical protein